MNLQFFVVAVEAFCSTGLWITSSLERVGYARVQPRPSGADRCRRDYPEVIVWSRGSDCGADSGINCGGY